MMFDAETLRLVAAFLAIFVPVVGVFFAFRREMQKAAQPPNVGAPGLVAIGGALASKEGALLHVEALEKQARSLDLQTNALNRLAESWLEAARAEQERFDLLRKFLEEVERHRKATEGIEELMRRSGVYRERDRG